MKQVFWPYLTLAIGVLVGLGFGYFFGLKTQKVENKVFTSDVSSLTQAEAKPELKIVTRTVDEVHFFKPDEDRICPEEYPIKAKFDGTTAIFYAASNKSYKQVKPQLCFTSAESANQKGFLEKK
ncbi:MAG: hypothetical protein OHK0017_03960 [Patescibacteria group bacterium]